MARNPFAIKPEREWDEGRAGPPWPSPDNDDAGSLGQGLDEAAFQPPDQDLAAALERNSDDAVSGSTKTHKISVLDVDPGQPRFDEESGSMEIPLPDGSVIIDLNPQGYDDDEEAEGDPEFDENLALKIADYELNKIAEDLIEGIEQDDKSRSGWLASRKAGIDLLGLKVEAGGSSADTSGAPLEGMSKTRHPLLQEAVLRFQANAYAELCPAQGPAKVVNYGDQTPDEDSLAAALEKDMNYYLTTTATEYYDDTNSMLFWVGFGGMAAKKVYRCPLRRRPVSESVDAQDLIVSNGATNLRNASRVTHAITMRKSVMRRMQLLGVYRDVHLTDPEETPNVVDEKIANVQGVAAKPDRPEDADHSIYECYCELDIPGYEDKDEDGNPTGLALPYRVTIEKTSRKVLEIRRNWNEDDEDREAKMPFVVFRYVNGMGFYGIGLLHILGNTTSALTAAWRLMLDAYMFGNFPGFLYLQGAGRQTTNEFRIPPGGGQPIKSDATDIRQAIMPLPYKSPDASMGAFIDSIANTGQRVGGTADTPVGEGTANAPVGTTLALIEQATKIESTVHKGLHNSQDQEFRLLKELFKADPESLWRGNARCSLKRNMEKTLRALEDCDIVPRADPNVPSRMYRLAKIAAVKQLQMANPMLYDGRAVDTWALPQLGVDDPESLFAAPPEPQQVPPDPIAMGKLQLDGQKLALNAQKLLVDAQTDAANRKSKENIAIMNLAKTLAVHPEANNTVRGTLANGMPGGANVTFSEGGVVDPMTGQMQQQIAASAPAQKASNAPTINISMSQPSQSEPVHDPVSAYQRSPETDDALRRVAEALAASRQPVFNEHLRGYDVGVV